MNVEIEAEAVQFPEKEYINGIAFAVWGQILRQNPDKSLKPPCYSELPLQLFFEISISSNSHNLYSYCTLVAGISVPLFGYQVRINTIFIQDYTWLLT